MLPNRYKQQIHYAKTMKFWGLALTLALLISLMFCMPAGAQEESTPTPEPTITPTPSYQQGVPMSTGSTLLIEKKVTYGEIAIVVSVLVLATVQLAKSFVMVPKAWFTR